MKCLIKLFNRNLLSKQNSKVYVVLSKRLNHTENVKHTHFGFETVKEEEKTGKVYEVFETVATSYDTMNDAMSFGIHRVWKDIFIDRLGPTHDTRLLDVAGGTGDIAFRFLKYLDNLPRPLSSSSQSLTTPSQAHVTVADINRAMLDVGQKRAENIFKFQVPNERIDFLEANAEQLPIEEESYTAYTIAFGIRNVTHIDEALREAYRVLKPGGRFLCLEFSHVNNSVLQWAYDQYSFQVIPVMGQLIAGQWKPYQYLVESIRQFPNQENFKELIEDAGFKYVSYENLTFGVVAIHSGFKL